MGAGCGNGRDKNRKGNTERKRKDALSHCQ